MKTVEFSNYERERILREELVRLQVRKEIRRKQAPRRVLLAVVWAAVLGLLAYANPYLHLFSRTK